MSYEIYGTKPDKPKKPKKPKMTSPLYDQNQYQFGSDNNTESTYTLLGTKNNAYSLNVTGDSRIILRIGFVNTNAKAGTQSYTLQYQQNGSGGYSTAVPISAGSTFVYITTALNGAGTMDDADVTTQRISTGGFDAGQVDTGNSITGQTVNASNSTELVWCLYVDASNISNGDYVEFRVYGGGAVLNAYTVTARLNFTVPATDNLLANDITTGTPTLDSATIGQIHVLDANNISTQSTLTSPAIGQIHVLLADDLMGGTPTLTTPNVSEIVDLLANDITSGTPTLSTPTLVGISGLLANDILSGTPTLTSPAIGQTHILNANDLTGGTPTLSTPALSIVGLLDGDYIDYPNRVGPFYDSNGALYAITYTSGATDITVHKSTDKGSTWNIQDASNNPTTTGAACVDAQKSGTTIVIVHHNGTGCYRHVFNMSDNGSPDQWATVDDAIATSLSVTYPSCALAVQSDGDILALYNNGSAIKYKIYTGTWGSENSLDGAVGIESWVVAVLGATDVIYVFYVDLSNRTLYQRSFTAAFSKGSPTSITTALKSAYAPIVPAIYWDDSGEKIMVGYIKNDGKIYTYRATEQAASDNVVTVV